tara:strand:- start:694 stop:1032 length:339 start_codon:yes stop_codon:yes gene_type:complete
MKKLFLLFIVITASFAQENNKKIINPCADPIISYARKFGVKAIPIKDLPHYFKVSKACREKGGDAVIDQVYINEYSRDFDRSKFMSSWTSTYGMCVTAIIFYFFVGLITVEK